MKRKKSRRIWLWAAIVLCLAVMVGSGTVIARTYLRSSTERNANARLADQVHQLEQGSGGAGENKQADGLASGAVVSGVEGESILPQYEALWQQNNDLAGWLYAEGTNIDHPVMYTPEEPEYYLRRGFDRESAHSGSLFISEDCTPDGSHVIIYGHNMKDGTMFSTLLNYDKAEFVQAHPTISYDTLFQEGEYEVIAAFYSYIHSAQDTSAFNYFEYTDLSQPETFWEYIEKAKAESLYDTGVEVQEGDQILTLSTCSYHTNEGRFVVVARRITK